MTIGRTFELGLPTRSRPRDSPGNLILNDLVRFSLVGDGNLLLGVGAHARGARSAHHGGLLRVLLVWGGLALLPLSLIRFVGSRSRGARLGTRRTTPLGLVLLLGLRPLRRVSPPPPARSSTGDSWGTRSAGKIDFGCQNSYDPNPFPSSGETQASHGEVHTFRPWSICQQRRRRRQACGARCNLSAYTGPFGRNRDSKSDSPCSGPLAAFGSEGCRRERTDTLSLCYTSPTSTTESTRIAARSHLWGRPCPFRCQRPQGLSVKDSRGEPYQIGLSQARRRPSFGAKHSSCRDGQPPDCGSGRCRA